MTALAVARVSLRRAAGDRTTLFFLVVLPLLVVVILGATTAGIDRVRVGVLVLDDGPQASALVDALASADGLTVTQASSIDALETSIRERDRISAREIERAIAHAMEARQTDGDSQG